MGELLATINENFLSEITKMFLEKEKEEKIKLLMANKRTSSRQERLREQKEKEFNKRREEEERVELMRREEEEAKKKQLEKENKEKNSRENRMLKREQKQIYARIISDHDYLLQDTQTDRKRGRDVVENHDDDHDHGGDEDDVLTNMPRKRNPALREFQRLAQVKT